jgi:beta-glucosidase
VIETEEHIDAARKATRIENAMFLTAVMEGRYIDSYLAAEGANAPVVQHGDMRAIGSPLDFVALNVYGPSYVRADASAPGYKILPRLPSSPRMASPWLYVGPEVACWSVRCVHDLWKPKALYISENGCSADMKFGANHAPLDRRRRISHPRRHRVRFSIPQWAARLRLGGGAQLGCGPN